MIKLINLTGQNSKIGTIVKQSPKRDNAFIYASVNETKPVFIVTQDGVKPLQPCNVESAGVVKVFVRGQANKGDIIRSRISGDINVNGAGFVTKSTDSNYVNIGTALSTGRNTLIEVNLNIYYSAQSEDKSLDVDHITANTSHFGDDTNYTEFEADGSMNIVGTAKVWDDLRVEPNVRGTGANNPSFEKYFDTGAGSRGVYLYSFDDANAGSEKEVFFTMQLPHAWAGTAVSVHAHWVGAVADTSSAPRWGLEYTWADIGEAFPNTLIIYTDGVNYTGGTPDTGITAGKHYISEFADLTPTAAQNGISAIFIGRLFRDSANAGDTYNASGAKCGLLYIDAHYEINTLGSRDEYAK